MAINIFSGQSGKSVNKASQSSRAQAAKQALGSIPSETSSSGNTAVGSNSTLAKIGNVVGNIAGVASKFLPGVAGTVASGLANMFNDPEWWQSVPGEQITMNVPQRIVRTGDTTEAGDGTLAILSIRPAIVEFVSCAENGDRVIEPTDNMVTQYLMTEIRKVVNAIPLQSVQDYRVVLQSHCTVYALWRQLKKFDFMLKHGTTYIPNLNDNGFPLFRLENAAYLQSTINRLEEYLRANVRLPHTMCEYLAWRYGRVYKTCDSARAGFVIYNVFPMALSIETLSSFIDGLFNVPSSTVATQSANADIFNTYYDHDMMVEIRDDTQMQYDAKEFALRTNLDITADSENIDSIPVFIDSKLDNPTVFMASTVSTYGGTDIAPTVLFPTRALRIYIYLGADGNLYDLNSNEVFLRLQQGNSDWAVAPYYPAQTLNLFDDNDDEKIQWIRNLALLKATDIYNKNLYLKVEYANKRVAWDVSQLNMDMGTVSGVVIQNEHVFAFANLIDITRKVSQTIKAANKEAAREVANMVETLDVATTGAK